MNIKQNLIKFTAKFIPVPLALFVLTGCTTTPGADQTWLVTTAPLVRQGVAIWVGYDLSQNPQRRTIYENVSKQLRVLSNQKAPNPADLVSLAASFPVAIFETFNVNTAEATKVLAAAMADGVDQGLATSTKAFTPKAPAKLNVVEPKRK